MKPNNNNRAVTGLTTDTPCGPIELSASEVTAQAGQPPAADMRRAVNEFDKATNGEIEKEQSRRQSTVRRKGVAENNTAQAQKAENDHLNGPITKEERDAYMSPRKRALIHLGFTCLILVVLVGGMTQIQERLADANLAGSRLAKYNPLLTYLYPFTLLFVAGLCAGLVCIFIKSKTAKRFIGLKLILVCVGCVAFTAMTKSVQAGKPKESNEGNTSRRRNNDTTVFSVPPTKPPFIRFFEEQAPYYVLFTSFAGEISGTAALKIAWFLTLAGHRSSNRHNSPEAQRNRAAVKKCLEEEAECDRIIGECDANIAKIKKAKKAVCRKIVSHFQLSRSILVELEEAQAIAEQTENDNIINLEATLQAQLQTGQTQNGANDAKVKAIQKDLDDAKELRRKRKMDVVNGEEVPATKVKQPWWKRGAAAVAAVVALVTFNSCSEPQEAIVIPENEQDTIAIYVSNELPDDEARDAVYKLVSDLALNRIGLGDTVQVYDGTICVPVAEFAVPHDTIFENNGRFREELFAEELKALNQWLGQEAPNKEKTLALHIPEIFRMATTLGLDETDHLVFVGSAQFTLTKEIAWTMEGDFVPSDGTITAPPIAEGGCVYSQVGREGLLPCSVHWIYLQDDFAQTRYRRAVERYWSASVAYISGTMRSMEVSVNSVLPRLAEKKPYTGSVRCDDFNPGKVEMVRYGNPPPPPPPVQDNDPIPSDQNSAPRVVSTDPREFLRTNRITTAPLPVTRLSNLRLGITWSNEGHGGPVDIDIHVTRKGYPTLFFGHNRNDDGSYHWKDFLDAPGGNALELVQMGEEEIALEDLVVGINNYSSPKSGKPIKITFRMQVPTGQVYSTNLELPGNGGNKGAGGNQSPLPPHYWRLVDLIAMSQGAGVQVGR